MLELSYLEADGFNLENKKKRNAIPSTESDTIPILSFRKTPQNSPISDQKPVHLMCWKMKFCDLSGHGTGSFSYFAIKTVFFNEISFRFFYSFAMRIDHYLSYANYMNIDAN